MNQSILSHDEEIIIAQCTPPGSGAIALLRISGANSWNVVQSMAQLASGKKLIDQQPHTIHTGWVVDQAGHHIDQVLFLLMRGPRTFTGQDTVEITSHNNPFIINAIIERALACGARMAKEGEFSRRAVINGKIDLLQAEAINELIHANTSVALKQSLAQIEGSLSSWSVYIEQTLLKALAYCQASFEFLDEEMEFGSQVRQIIQQLLDEIAAMEKTFNQQQQIRQGIRIAILGSVNAGKSSLFNALLAHERAIVTEIPGTTRDTIEAGIYRDGNYLTLIDTAGLRVTDDIIETQGIERSRKEAARADIIILVVDGSCSLSPQELAIYQTLLQEYAQKIILVRNKTDLPSVDVQVGNGENTCIDCSCTKTQHISDVEQAIEAKVNALLCQIDTPFLLNQRQFNLIMSLKKKLNEIISMFKEPIQYELLAVHLNDALALISNLTGKSISEQGLDAVFREFCVGK